MNYESDMGTTENIDAACGNGSENDLDSGGERCANGVTHQRPQRWAWTAAGGHYDWMDSYGPFASLD